MTAKETAKQAVHGCGDFQDFNTYQAAYGFLKRVRRYISRWSDTMYANTSVEKVNGKWRARVSAAREA
jgi:hypothetical protein